MQKLVTDALERLTSEAVPSELLAELQDTRKRFGFRTAKKFVPIVRIWQLGVLLLDTDGKLWSEGSVTRAVDPKHPGHHSVTAEQRRAIRAIAYTSGLAEAEVVHFGALPITLDSTEPFDVQIPLFKVGEKLLVKWHPGCTSDQAIEFKKYLNERVDLVVERFHDSKNQN